MPKVWERSSFILFNIDTSLRRTFLGFSYNLCIFMHRSAPESYHMECVPISDLRATDEQIKQHPVPQFTTEEEWQEVFLNFHFSCKSFISNHRKPYFGFYSSHLPMASFAKFFSFLIIYSKKGAYLNYPIGIHSWRLGQANLNQSWLVDQSGHALLGLPDVLLLLESHNTK